MAGRDLVKTNYPKVVDLFESTEVNQQLKKALPDFITADKLIRVALTAIRTNPDLLECSRQSLLACLFACGQLGLSPEPFLGQAYFVPFWNSRLNSLEAQFIPGYRGYITLWRRSGVGKKLSAQVVYEKDHFKIQYGLHEVLDHIPADGDRGGIKGAWAVFTYRDGNKNFEYMTYSDLMKIKERTKSRNKKGEIVGPWITDEAEMCKKSVIKRGMKLQPLSVEDKAELIYRASQAEELALTGGSQRDFFLPHLADETPVEITGSIADRSDEFDKAMGPELINDPLFQEFLSLTVDSNEISIKEVKTQAMDDAFQFKNVFYQWKANRENSQDDQAESKDTKSGKGKLRDRLPKNQIEFWDEWRSLKSAGFEKFVTENLELFRTCHPELRKEARKKYRNVVGKIWPLDAEKQPDDPGVRQPDPEHAQGTDDKNIDPNVKANYLDIKQRYPRQYLNVTGGKIPKTTIEMQAVIIQVEELVDQERGEGSSGDIPSA